MTSFSAFTWLVHTALASTILLAAAAAAVSIVRQPADRLRLIQWALVATLCALVLLSVPQFSALSLGLLASRDPAPPATAPPPVLKVSQRDAAPAPQEFADSPPVREQFAASAEPPRSAPLRVETLAADSPAQTSAAPIDSWTLATRGICIAYAVGVVLFFARWLLARIGLARLLRGASPVPADVRAELVRIGGARGERVRLLASPHTSGPVTWGTRRPVIVIPSSVLGEPDRVRLRYYLAHEWAHVARRDFATWQFAALVQIFLYYQPLVWWLRSRLAICMDQLADADAADEGDSTADYADFLVELARLRLAPNPRLSLGISDRRSGLYQRVVFLLNAARPRPACPRKRSLAIAGVTLALAALVSVVRLDAEPAAEAPSVEKEKPAAAPQGADPPASPYASFAPDGTITYTGEVTDAASGKPIEGVKVLVHHKESTDWKTLEVTEHETDAQGRYRFVIPPEQAALGYLYLEVEAHQPDYCPKSRSGYSHAMIKKNLKLGEDPFYAHIRLWPGEAVTGIIVNPEGQPLADVEVSMYSKSAHSKEMFRGAWGKTTTDAAGAFRIVPATPGDGVLWIKPAQYAPQAHRLADRRGDWGEITVEKGTDLTGRLLDVQGQGVSNVKIEARRRGDGEKADEFLSQNAVAGGITRETVSGPAGEFTLASLPPGQYTLRYQSNTESYDPPPLEQVFLRPTVSIVDGTPPEPLEIRAVPHVVIHGQYLDSAGKPRRGSEVMLFGKIDGGNYFTESNQPEEDGKFEIRAPHGLTETRLDLITNEHSALRWRLKPGEPLMRGRHITLGTLEDDVHGFEVVRYVAPILLVKPVDEQGAPVKDCQPVLKYTRPQGDAEQLTVYTTRSNVSFEEQQDGRWRSEQLLPDEPVSVTIDKAGYTTTAQELSLPEGAERELTFVLKKDSGETKPEESSSDEK